MARGAEQLERTAAEIRTESGVRVLAVPTDITESGSVKAAADKVKAELATVHIVVNNAGAPMRRMDRQITWPDADWVSDVNSKLIGMLRVTQAFLP
jgi:NADP-dependent 3-hydroxy acid dehydrogenase YdfG